jgi:hypothetical protein
MLFHFTVLMVAHSRFRTHPRRTGWPHGDFPDIASHRTPGFAEFDRSIEF